MNNPQLPNRNGQGNIRGFKSENTAYLFTNQLPRSGIHNCICFRWSGYSWRVAGFLPQHCPLPLHQIDTRYLTPACLSSCFYCICLKKPLSTFPRKISSLSVFLLYLCLIICKGEKCMWINFSKKYPHSTSCCGIHPLHTSNILLLITYKPQITAQTHILT